MSLYTVPCVVFAGGKSSRMGEDKAFLPFGGYKSLVEYQVRRLEKIFTNVYVSAKSKDKFSNIHTTVIEDILHCEISAPTTGLINIYRELKNENFFFILSVDTPFVDEKLISRLIQESTNGYEAVIARTSSGIHPLCGIYTRALEEPIKKMIEDKDYKLGKLLKSARVHYIDVEDEQTLSNLNTPGQYQKALADLKS